MLKRELVRGIVISNTCVKLYRNWIINEVARAGEHTNERTYVRTYVRTYSHTYVRDRPYIPSTTLLCEGITKGLTNCCVYATPKECLLQGGSRMVTKHHRALFHKATLYSIFATKNFTTSQNFPHICKAHQSNSMEVSAIDKNSIRKIVPTPPHFHKNNPRNISSLNKGTEIVTICYNISTESQMRMQREFSRIYNTRPCLLKAKDITT